jgi:hypothetical protein
MVCRPNDLVTDNVPECAATGGATIAACFIRQTKWPRFENNSLVAHRPRRINERIPIARRWLKWLAWNYVRKV